MFTECFRALGWTLPLSLLLACGAGQEEVKGPDPCKVTIQKLSARVGPEMGSVVTQTKLTLPAPSLGGCAVTYTQVAEEMTGEVDGESVDPDSDHNLAIGLPDDRGIALTLLNPSQMAPGAVTMQIKLADVDGDKQAELTVEEGQGFGADSYRGLRVFDYEKGVPQEIFAEQMKVTTPEGLSLVPEWKLGAIGKTRAIIFDGAGTKIIHTWDGAAKRFTLNAEETKKHDPAFKAAQAAAKAKVEAEAAAKAKAKAEAAADAKKAEAAAAEAKKAEAKPEEKPAGLPPPPPAESVGLSSGKKKAKKKAKGKAKEKGKKAAPGKKNPLEGLDLDL